jgi:hypothetical protein
MRFVEVLKVFFILIVTFEDFLILQLRQMVVYQSEDVTKITELRLMSRKVQREITSRDTRSFDASKKENKSLIKCV